MAELTGFDLKKCPQEIMYTAENEPMITYHAKIKVRLDDRNLLLPCVFTDRNDTPFSPGTGWLY